MRAGLLLFLLSLACGVAAFSCSVNEAAPGAGAGPAQTVDPTTSAGLPCDVDTVLETSCRSCHGASPLHGAPMSLVTHDDLTAVSRMYASEHVFERVATRIHDSAKPMPPPPNAALSGDDMATLDRWIAAGAPRADEACGPAKTPPAATAKLSCSPDVHMKPTSAWAMPETVDDEYVCYGFDVTADQKRHLTAIAPLIDNPSIVHHLVLFEASHSVSGVPAPCNESASAQMRILYGWAPGGKALELPVEAGFAQEGTTHYVVQVHYNNVQHQAGQSDA
ncbi:MAG: peptidylglycine alpha-amidating monooxygenase, partial [Labilithrix sp.]|nr:peptidylglycine alpha-amidating monooxygenase [Labilithrix sp.]